MTNTNTTPSNHSSSLASRLRRAVELEGELARVSKEALAMVTASGRSRRELAAAMGVASPSTVQRIVGSGAAYNATLETLSRLADACGYELRVTFVPRDTRQERVAAIAGEPAGEPGQGRVEPEARLLFLSSVSARPNRWQRGGAALAQVG